MADIDNELNDLYSQLSSLSNGQKSQRKRIIPLDSGKKLISRKNLRANISPSKVDRVKSIFASEIQNRERNTNVFDSAGLKEQADKQNELRRKLRAIRVKMK